MPVSQSTKHVNPTVLKAMHFGIGAHRGHVLGSTKLPYRSHLAETVGLLASCIPDLGRTRTLAVAWLRGCIERGAATEAFLEREYTKGIAAGVVRLSEFGFGEPTESLFASRHRLAKAPDWLQNIVCAGLISAVNAPAEDSAASASVSLDDALSLLEVLEGANGHLHAMAWDLFIREPSSALEGIDDESRDE